MTIKSEVLFTKEWHKPCLDLLKSGVSNRQVAKTLFGNDTFESRIRTFLEREDVKKELSLETSSNDLKILYFDIETSPELSYTWRRFKENISDIQVLKYSHILSIAWAFNDGDVESSRLSVNEVKDGDDLTTLVNFLQAYSKADAICSFNGKKFDSKIIKTRMLFHGLPALKPKPHIDLFQEAKKHFRFPSNSMNNISKYLGYSILKQETGGFQLWKDCLDVDNYEVSDKALDDMEIYNQHDIIVTRNLYKKMQGWVTGTNLGAIVNHKNPEKHTLRCKCGSDDIFLEDGFHYTQQNGFQLYRCGSCSGVTRINSNGSKLLGV